MSEPVTDEGVLACYSLSDRISGADAAIVFRKGGSVEVLGNQALVDLLAEQLPELRGLPRYGSCPPAETAKVYRRVGEAKGDNSFTPDLVFNNSTVTTHPDQSSNV